MLCSIKNKSQNWFLNIIYCPDKGLWPNENVFSTCFWLLTHQLRITGLKYPDHNTDWKQKWALQKKKQRKLQPKPSKGSEREAIVCKNPNPNMSIIADWQPSSWPIGITGGVTICNATVGHDLLLNIYSLSTPNRISNALFLFMYLFFFFSSNQTLTGDHCSS